MKVFVVVIEKKDGTSEIVGVFKDVGTAMIASSDANNSGNTEYKEVYLQEHVVQEKEQPKVDLKDMVWESVREP